jgi:hypothetical protein
MALIGERHQQACSGAVGSTMAFSSESALKWRRKEQMPLNADDGFSWYLFRYCGRLCLPSSCRFRSFQQLFIYEAYAKLRLRPCSGDVPAMAAPRRWPAWQ